MAERVGARGYVLATDIDTRWIQNNGLSQLEVQRHDVVADPLAQGEFDLIHARLVLSWLPARDTVVSCLVEALRPGGWLIVEDFDSLLHWCLDPLNDDERVFVKVADAFVQALHRRGADTTWPRTLPHRLASAGLVDVGAAGHLTIYHGGSAAAQVPFANIDQVGDGLILAGLITTAEQDTFLRLLRDPSFVGNNPLLITAWGKKPVDQQPCEPQSEQAVREAANRLRSRERGPGGMKQCSSKVQQPGRHLTIQIDGSDLATCANDLR